MEMTAFPRKVWEFDPFSHKPFSLPEGLYKCRYPEESATAAVDLSDMYGRGQNCTKTKTASMEAMDHCYLYQWETTASVSSSVLA